MDSNVTERTLLDIVQLCRDKVEAGWLYFYQGNYDNARKTFQSANELQQSVEAYQGIIATYRKSKRFSEASEDIKKMPKHFRDSAQICSEQGWLYFDQKLYAQSVNEILSLYPDKDKNVIDNIMVVLTKLRQDRGFFEAKNILQQACNKRTASHLDDLYAKLTLELGLFCLELRQYKQSISAFEKILAYRKEETDALRSDALRYKVAVLRLQGDFKQAGYILGIHSDDDFSHGSLTTSRWRRITPHKNAITEIVPDALRKTVSFLMEIGWLHLDQKQYDEALRFFNLVVLEDKTNEGAHQGILASYRLKRDFAQVKDHFSLLPLSLAESAGILSEKGWLCFEQGQYEQAQTVFEKANELHPNNLSLKFALIEVLIRLHHLHKPKELLCQLHNPSLKDFVVQEQLGLYYLRCNDLKSAEDAFMAIYSYDNSHVAALGGLGSVRFCQARFKEAEQMFLKARNAEPCNPLWYVRTAWALLRQENAKALEEAITLCTQARKLAPDYADTFGCLGVIAFKQGNLREAEDYLLTSIKFNRLDGSYTDIGALYIQTGQYEDAEKYLKKAIANNRYNAQARIHLGTLYLQLDDTKKALREFRQAMVTDVQSEDAPRALSIALIKTSEYKEAEAVLRTALKRLDEAKRWKLHLTLAELLTRLGDDTGNAKLYEEALEEIIKAKGRYPAETEAYFHAGIVRYKLKDYPAAIKEFRRCGPDHYEAERHARSIQTLIREQAARSRASTRGGISVGVICILLVPVFWIYFYFHAKVDLKLDLFKSLLLATPTLLAMSLVAFVLPSLIKLKVPGLEAELSQPKETISAGPKGEIGFSIAVPSISPGIR